MRRLTKLADVIRFQAVCKPWTQAVIRFRQSLPVLMKSPAQGDRIHRFVDVTEENKWYDVESAVDQRGVLDKLRGSSFGWLLIMDQKSSAPPQWFPDLYLLNPFTRTQIPLLGEGRLRPTLRVWDVWAFAMLGEPTAIEGCVVMIFYYSIVMIFYYSEHGTEEIAFSKLGGDQKWTSIPLIPKEAEDIHDIVFWRNRFHAVCSGGRIFVCDLNEPHGKPIISRAFIPKVPANDGYINHARKLYLVIGPEGELMLVARSHKFRTSEIQDGYNYTTTFRVYKMNEEEKTWDEVVSIGDYVLFVDHHKAIYVSSKDHPKSRKNCVYYKQKGIYDLGNEHNDCDIDFSFDTWILPSN